MFLTVLWTALTDSLRNALKSVCPHAHFILLAFFSWDLLYTRLNSHHKTLSYKKKKNTKKYMNAQQK